MALNFTDSLDHKVADIERPPLPPLGTYRFMVMKHPEIEEGVADQWDIVNFQMKAVEAQDDVDADELAEYGKVDNIVIRHSFMFDKTDQAKFKTAEYNLRRFLQEHLRIDKVDKVSLKEALAASVNHQCLGVVNYRADKNDPEVQYAQIRRTAPVE